MPGKLLPKASASETSKPGRLILLADDFADNREMYAHCLSEAGFRVALATNGVEALDKAIQLQPDLIVMDLSMPLLGGGEASKRLKADERTNHIPIMILTAYGPDHMAQTFFEAGYAGFFVKPCLPSALLAEVVRVLGG